MEAEERRNVAVGESMLLFISFERGWLAKSLVRLIQDALYTCFHLLKAWYSLDPSEKLDVKGKKMQISRSQLLAAKRSRRSFLDTETCQ